MYYKVGMESGEHQQALEELCVYEPVPTRWKCLNSTKSPFGPY